MTIEIQIRQGESYYGLACNEGVRFPLTQSSSYEFDLRTYHSGNQASSVLLSTRGKYIYSDYPFHILVKKGIRTLEGKDILVKENGQTLKSAHQGLIRDFFHSDHRIPDERRFTRIQYNTWIERGWDCTEEKVLQYASSILEHGYPAGILRIDDCWCKDYGEWDFDPSKFKNPGKRVEKLHQRGFLVMLWCCPFVSPDSARFRSQESLFFRNKKGDTGISHWWNGYSAVYDRTLPEARSAFLASLSFLKEKYGIDGFKLDAGDPEYYPDDFEFHGIERSRQAKEYAALGEKFPLSELRVAFNNNLKGVAHRLRDKNHSWNEDGINTLIPDGIREGLLGYPYFCPDRIGGGRLLDFTKPDFVFSQDLFVRYAQAAAYRPRRQFSLMPYKKLDEEHLEAVKKAIDIHLKNSGLIVSLAKRSKETGEPIVKPLNYFYPGSVYDSIKDEFVLTEDFLVAPRVQEGTSREVVIPDGIWVDETGKQYSKGTYRIEVPLNRIPVFRKR